MKGRYRTKTGWRVFILIFGPLFIALGVYLLATLNTQETEAAKWIVAPVSLGLIGLMSYATWDSVFGYYEIGDDFVAHRTIFGKKVVPIADIKGVAVNDKYILLVAKPGKRGLDISRYIQSSDDIAVWAYTTFEDLDAQISEKEDVDILEELAQDQMDSHDEKLEKAKKVSGYLYWSGVGIGFWAFFYPRPWYDLIVIAAMVIPLVILISVISLKGYLRFNGVEKSRYPVMAYPFMVPICGLSIRAIFDFDVLSYVPLWTQAFTVSIVITCIMVWLAKEFSLRSWKSALTVFLFLCFTYAYSVSSLIIINCRFDSSNAQTFEAKILSKEKDSGKRTEYYLDLSPWGPRTEHEKVSVGPKAFERANVGDTVEVYLYQGRLNAKWFEIGI